MTRDDGGPAFPCAVQTGTEVDDGHLGVTETPVFTRYPGMSLRDWFAGQAARGAADAICAHLEDGDVGAAKEEAARHAQACGLFADAMLKERAK